MKTKILVILAFIIIALSSVSYGVFKLYLKEKKDNNRLSKNISSLNENLTYYKSRNGHLVGKNSVLVFRLSEFKSSFSDLAEQIEDLRINVNRISSVSNTVIESEKHITTTLKDSIINDTIIAKTFRYNDAFYDIKGLAIGSTQTVTIQSTDSILQVVYKGKRRKPYLWFLSKRQLEQVITNKNPNSKITYSKHIEITK